ncbi:site-specific integrase [Moorella sulfitireducens (nom. illeg.)]|uniref:site-specific integrase n=1 Tax=Neomoorella sulfitireducens TaxID=2972948 RepID=UPI0021AD4472|nr:site-specific integrase [Moorella sulfitireducens]
MGGSIEKRGKNTWRIRYELPRDPKTGKRRQGSRTVHGTKKDAEKVLRDILTQIDQGTHIEPSDLPLEKFLNQWLQMHRANIRDKTFYRYEGIIRNHINPTLGKIPLSKLTPYHIQCLYTEKLAENRSDGEKGGLSKASVRYIHSVLHKALETAVNLDMIPRNPADKVQPPSPEDTEITPLTEEQVARFLDAAKGNRFEALFITVLGTGLRRGEVLGLRWEDIDLQNGLLTVQRTLEAAKGKLKFVPPKTKTSKRTISLPSSVVEALKKHRIQQMQHKLRLGPMYQDQGLVFPSETGTPLNPDNLDRYFKPILKKAGLPDIRFHDLRHTHATLLIKRGEDIKMVSQRLGHSDVAFTIRVYHHVMPNVEREAMLRFDEVLQGSGQKK